MGRKLDTCNCPDDDASKPQVDAVQETGLTVPHERQTRVRQVLFVAGNIEIGSFVSSYSKSSDQIIGYSHVKFRSISPNTP